MQTINNRMTETQIADLFSLAVQLQVKAEESDDRDTAILAYSIQNACSNLTESRREFRSADATIHNLELKLTDMAVQLANAESKCRELAAENGALKVAIDEHSQGFTVCNCCGTENDCSHDDVCRVLNETPATDAFLADVRAQGVEMMVEQCESDIMLIEPEDEEHYILMIEHAKEFAAQLRKGAAL